MPRPQVPSNAPDDMPNMTPKGADAANAPPNGQAENASQAESTDTENGANHATTTPATLAQEFGGQKGPEPTRYGDWEKNGRCTDF